MHQSVYDLANMLKHLRQAKNYAESIKREKSIGSAVKDRINGVISRCSAAEREILGSISREAKELLETQLLNMETTTQLDGIQDMLLGLNQHSRDLIEKYVESVHKLNVVAA